MRYRVSRSGTPPGHRLEWLPARAWRLARPATGSILPALIWLLVAGGSARPAQAQLVSPGKLAEPHSEVSGLRNCTKCHTLGQRGIGNDNCLACHEPLRNRTEKEVGLHARYQSQSCSDCHKDHFGVDFRLVRFEPEAFEHADSGYELSGAHTKLGCRECHQPLYMVDEATRRWKSERGALRTTYLGLGAECLGCHAADDPHEEQFAPRGCLDCHAEVGWEGAERFDHASTRYRLTGRHRTVACSDCHRPVRHSSGKPFTLYAEIEFSNCTSCHRDSHDGALGAGCRTCHSTSGWRQIKDPSFEDTFDHAKTGFTLAGAHAEATCASCHAASVATPEIRLTYQRGTERFTYARPLVEDCTSCHRDYHDGVFADRRGGALCDDCHGEVEWLPTSFGIARHNEEASYQLTGAHVATPCVACHLDPELGHDRVTFRFADNACVSCHAEDNPHGDQFEDVACSSCHVTESFRSVVFDHTETRFPLDGEHSSVPCVACHEQVAQDDGSVLTRFKPLGTDCKDCH